MVDRLTEGGLIILVVKFIISFLIVMGVSLQIHLHHQTYLVPQVMLPEQFFILSSFMQLFLLQILILIDPI